jgi:hypothetical protein
MPVVNDTSEIARFLGREVSLATYTWNVGASPFFRINPWSSLLAKPSIAEKVKYFSRLRADINIRLNISGTPFHYGMAMLTYRPHVGVASTSDPQYNLAIAAEATLASNNLKVAESQLIGIRFQPGYDSSVELHLPYIHHKPGIELAVGAHDDIGILSIIGLTPLRHANAGTNPVSIEVLASFSNVVLDVPTAIAQGFTLDEAIKKVSAILSAGTVATKLAGEWTPVVQSAVASLGFSRPALNSEPTSVRQLPYQLANYDLPDTVERLALSANSEAAIDGVGVGCGVDDELMVSRIASRPGFIASAAWDTTQARGTFLLGSFVTPQQQSVSTYQKAAVGAQTFGTVNHTAMTPCAFAASMFTHWKCTMVYRFTVVASPYHKGRLRVWFDPSTSSIASPELNLNNSTVLNLAEDSVVEIRVPWQNVRDAARTEHVFLTNTFTNSGTMSVRASAVNSSVCNGQIICEVLNPLVSPTDGSDVNVVLDVFAEDMVGYGPRIPRGGSAFNTPAVSDMEAVPYSPLSYDVSCGDAVASFRQLWKRYGQEYACQARSQSANGTGRLLEVLLPMYFPPPGYVALAADGLDVTMSQLPINYTTWSFRSYLSQAFALARGSVRWKVLLTTRNVNATGSLSGYVSRYYGTVADFAGTNRRRSSVKGSTAAGFESESTTARSMLSVVRGDEGLQVAGTHDVVAPFDVELPFVSAYRAFNPRAQIDTAAGDDRDLMNVVISSETAATVDTSYLQARIYTCAGEDFNVFHFTHAPALLDAIPAEL